MKLSIVIPVYNEEKTLPALLKRVEQVDLGNVTKEIILVDDGSTDGTKAILSTITDHKILYHSENKGKGAAVRTGFRHASGDMVIVQDADLEYFPEDYPSLIRPITEGKAKVVYGTRLKGVKEHMYLLHFIGNWGLTTVTNILFRSKLTDMETCYKVISKDVLDTLHLRANKFELEPEITAKILKNKHKIHEVPIRFTARKFEDGKKITWKDGIQAAYYLIKFRIMD